MSSPGTYGPVVGQVERTAVATGTSLAGAGAHHPPAGRQSEAVERPEQFRRDAEGSGTTPLHWRARCRHVVLTFWSPLGPARRGSLPPPICGHRAATGSGTTDSRSLSMSRSLVSPSASASKLSSRRWRRTGRALARMSSKATLNRPASRARTLPVSASAWTARGLAPNRTRPATSGNGLRSGWVALTNLTA